MRVGRSARTASMRWRMRLRYCRAGCSVMSFLADAINVNIVGSEPIGEGTIFDGDSAGGFEEDLSDSVAAKRQASPGDLLRIALSLCSEDKNSVAGFADAEIDVGCALELDGEL